MSGIVLRLLAVASLVVIVSSMTVSKKDSSANNHELMTKVGLSRRPVAPNHHRKRLASESRGSNADSHMFVIKLPPNQFYYSHYKPANGHNAVKKLSTGFRSNGKPGKIYHWNMPMLEKMAGKRKHASRLSDATNDVTKLQASSRWSESLKTEVHDKNKASFHGYHTRKTQRVEKPIMSYYVPATSAAKPRINKYFSGNGKPHSFYVIEKNKKPIKYHRLLS